MAGSPKRLPTKDLKVSSKAGPVASSIVEATEAHFDAHELEWKPQLEAQGALDAGWAWRADFLEIERDAVDRETYAMVRKDTGTVLGLLSLVLGADDIYVERLAVEPGSRPGLEGGPAYKGVGTALMLWAVHRSMALGREGKISLHSLEDPNTLAFYRHRFGMVETRVELVDGMLMRRFELSVAQATVLSGGAP